MKIILSYAEATQAISKLYNFPVTATVVIGKKPKKAAKPASPISDTSGDVEYRGYTIPGPILTDEHKKSMKTIIDLYLNNEKIAAIKELRATANYGLFQAKVCIEDFTNFMHALYKQKAFPYVSHLSGQNRYS